MEELLKSAARAHLIFIGVCISIIIFSISAQPNEQYVDAVAFINYGKDAFTRDLPKTTSSILNGNQELASIISDIRNIAHAHGITISSTQAFIPSNVFAHEIPGLEGTGRFSDKSGLTVRSMQEFLSIQQPLVVAVPNIEQLKEVLHTAFTGTLTSDKSPIILSGFRFDLIDDEPLSINNNPRLNVSGELGGLTGSRALINSAVSGIVKTLTMDIRQNLILPPSNSGNLDLIGYMTDLPSKRDIWDVISDHTVSEAKELLFAKMEAKKGKVDVFGISMNGEVVLIGGPMSLLAISTYLLMLIGDIERGVGSAETVPRYPWFVLFPDELSKAVSIMTLLVIPVVVGFSLIWVFRSGWLLSILGSACIIGTVLVCNIQTLKHAKLIRYSRNTTLHVSA